MRGGGQSFAGDLCFVEFHPRNMLKEGSKVWFAGKGETAGSWRQCRVIAQRGNCVTLSDETDNKKQQGTFQVNLDNEAVFPLNPSVEEDMTALHHIHEPGILHNLQMRSESDMPYTFMGPVLVSVNPLVELDEGHFKVGESSAQNSAHPFAIAEIAFQQMQLGTKALKTNPNEQADQSIVIGGESGSGKTEASKRVIRHLVARCKKFREQSSSNTCHDAILEELEERLIRVSPILESLGNASTCMNHNSSRFGKYTKILFVPLEGGGWRLGGAAIETYLLERSRLVYHGKGERTFHILHYLTQAKSSILKDLGLENGTFGLLGENKASPRTAEKFENVLQALKTVGIEDAVRHQLFQALAGILHFGDVQIQGDTDNSNLELESESVKWVCKLLGLEAVRLGKLLCTREVRFPGAKEAIETPVGAETAAFNRNAIMKVIYASLFDWVLEQVNKSLQVGANNNEEDIHFIGVLDIFGFESLQQNSFEQLLINYTNEALQDTFIKQVFESEQALYRSEGLIINNEEFPPPQSSSECVDLFVGLEGGLGLLAVIDEVGKAPQPTDDKLNQALQKRFQKHNCFPKPHPKDIRTTFLVKHFPGKVSYTVEGFLHKNNDSLPSDAREVLANAMNPVIASSVAKSQAPPVKGRRVTRSIVSKFGGQIKNLVGTLEATKCSFIRCVKPNVTMQRTKGKPWFDQSLVQAQLRCLSIAQTAQVLKSGLPTRILYSSLLEAYGDALPAEAITTWKCLGGGNEREFTKALFWAFDVPRTAYRCGKTRVFFRSGQLSMLDRILDASRVWSGPNCTDPKSQAEKAMVISRFKLYYVRMLWRKCVTKVVAVNHFMRSLARMRAAVSIQSVFRRVHASSRYLAVRAAVIRMQAFGRRAIARSAYLKLLQEKHEREERERLESERQERERQEREQKEREQLQADLRAKEEAEEVERTLLEQNYEAGKEDVLSFGGSIKPGGTEEREDGDFRSISSGSVFSSETEETDGAEAAKGDDKDSTIAENVLLHVKPTSPRPEAYVLPKASQEEQNCTSLEKCAMLADELLGVNPKSIDPAKIEMYKEQTFGPFSWQVLSSRLIQVAQHRAHGDSMVHQLQVQLQQSEERCWEYKVIAAEREARITELTTRILDMEKAGRRDPSEGLVAGQLSSEETESLSSLVAIIQSQQLQLASQTDEIARLTQRAEETREAKEYMAQVLDQLTLDLERERTQARRNFEFFEQKLREAENQVHKRDKLVQDYQMQLAKCKGLLAESLSLRDEELNAKQHHLQRRIIQYPEQATSARERGINAPVA